MSYYTTIGPLGTDVSSEELTFGTWEKIAEVDVTTATSTVTFTGLNGNADKAYMLVMRMYNPAVGVSWYWIRPNADSGANYNYQYAYASGTTITVASATGLTSGLCFPVGAGKTGTGVTVIVAPTGDERTFSSFGGSSNITVFSSTEWINTTSNITSLVVVQPGGNIGAGSKIILFKLSA